jgi:hypothetical protein
MSKSQWLLLLKLASLLAATLGLYLCAPAGAGG